MKFKEFKSLLAQIEKMVDFRIKERGELGCPGCGSPDYMLSPVAVGISRGAMTKNATCMDCCKRFSVLYEAVGTIEMEVKNGRGE